MSYCTTNELLLWYGAKELAEIATPDDRVPVSAVLMRLTIESGDRSGFTAEERVAADGAMTRIGAAIDQGRRLVDSHLARRFTLPLAVEVVAESPLPRVCAALVRAFLHENRDNETVINRRESALRWLRDLAAGTVALAGDPPVKGVVAGGPAHETGPRVFDERTLSGFAGTGSG